MPRPKVRSGNAVPLSASVQKAHGASPQSAELEFEGHALCSLDSGSRSEVRIGIGSCLWLGRALSAEKSYSWEGGVHTKINAVDLRDDLYNMVIFGKVNTIDENTGEVYSGMEKGMVPDSARDYIKNYNAAVPGYTAASVPGYMSPAAGEAVVVNFNSKLPGYASSAGVTTVVNGRVVDLGQLSYEMLGVDGQRKAPVDLTQYTGPIYPRDLIDWLCALAGFQASYSTESLRRLKSTQGVSWQSSRYNIFNVDWSNGVKVGSALAEICDRIGIVFCPENSFDRVLNFFVRGEKAHPEVNNDLGVDFENPFGIVFGNVEDPKSDLSPDLCNAITVSQGEAIQPDVDTGVWIVGEEDRWEWQSLKLVPYWNQMWNWVFFFEGKPRQYFDNLGVDIRTTTMRQLVAMKNNDVTKTPLDIGFFENIQFQDMTLEEYIENVLFHVYQIEIMDKILPEAEYQGIRPVRKIPISTPLVSNIGKQFLLTGHVVGKNHRKYGKNMNNGLEGLYDEGIGEIKSGFKVLENLGLVVFDHAQFKLAPKIDEGEHAGADWYDPVINPDQKPKVNLRDTDIIPDDELRINVVFLGDVYRVFFGDPKRIGTKRVSGLRRNMIVPDKNAEKEMAQQIYAAYKIAQDATDRGWDWDDDEVRATVKQIHDMLYDAVENGGHLINPDTGSAANVFSDPGAGIADWTAATAALQTGADYAEANAEEPMVYEHVQPGEKLADEIAADLADSYLSRQRQIKSGEAAFFGNAGHEPNGEIQRVTVSCSRDQGIQERCSFSNELPQLGVETFFELRRKIAQDMEMKRLESEARREKVDRIKVLKGINEDEALRRKQDSNILIQAALQNTNGNDNFVIGGFPQGKAETYKAGEPIVATHDVQNKIVLEQKINVLAKDPKLMGVNIVHYQIPTGNFGGKTNEQSAGGSVAICTEGVIPIRVQTPIKRGDKLMVAQPFTNLDGVLEGYFTLGEGRIVAMQDTEEQVESMSGGKPIIETILGKIESYYPEIMDVDLALDYTNTSQAVWNTALNSFIYSKSYKGAVYNYWMDGVLLTTGMKVLMAHVNKKYQGVWQVDLSVPNKAWTLLGWPRFVHVLGGDKLIETIWARHSHVATDKTQSGGPSPLGKDTIYFGVRAFLV